tara:strand:- start:4360 stop:5172 length:813 start_codon:yes stop_codon:yes gene_type:complete
MLTGTELPIFNDSEEEIEVAFYGSSGNISYSQSGNLDNLGWAVFVFGEYEDDNQNGYWDSCPTIQVFPQNESMEETDGSNQNNSFYEHCGPGNERYDFPSMIYVGQICHNPTNISTPDCEDGIYSIESNKNVRLIQEYGEEEKSTLSYIIDLVISGIKDGRSLACGGFALLLFGALLNLLMSNEVEVSITKKDGSKAEWRAYALSQTERGNDGLPKAFSRHKGTRDLYSKPKKGNVRGGVHKTGGLHLSGWTSEDSDKEYKKKVEDRRDR